MERLIRNCAPGEERIRRRLKRTVIEIRGNRKLLAADAFSVAMASMVAVLLSSGPHFSRAERAVLPEFVLLSLLVVLPVMALSGAYRCHRHASSLPGMLAVAPSAALGVALCGLIARGAGVFPELTLTTFPIMFLMLLSLSAGARAAARMREAARQRRRQAQTAAEGIPAVLVGLGPAADLFMRAVNDGLSPYRVVGIVDTSLGSTDLLFHTAPILGSVRSPGDVIRRLSEMPERPRCLLIPAATSHFETEGIATLRAWAEAQGVRIRALPGLTDGLAGGTGVPQPIDPEDILTRPQKRVELALLQQTYRGQRVLVTGAGGSIGSELVRQLASLDPAELILIENCELNAYHVDRMLARHFPNVPRALHIGCIRDKQHVEAIFAAHRPSLVFNAAALKHVPLVEANPCEGVLTNIIGTRNVCDAARRFGVRALVQVSTDKAVNTTNIMGATKRVAEFYCQALDLISRDMGVTTRFFAVRFGNVLGSSGSLIPLFQEQIARGGPLTITDARMERFFMTIREAVELTLVSAAHGLSDAENMGRIFVLDMGEPVPIVELAERMIRMAGKTPGTDIPIQFIGIRPGEKLYEELFDRAEQVVPASFPGVACAIPRPVAMPRLRAGMHRLEQAARAGDAAAVREGLAALVPGFGGEPVTEGAVTAVVPHAAAAAEAAAGSPRLDLPVFAAVTLPPAGPPPAEAQERCRPAATNGSPAAAIRQVPPAQRLSLPSVPAALEPAVA